MCISPGDGSAQWHSVVVVTHIKMYFPEVETIADLINKMLILLIEIWTDSMEGGSCPLYSLFIIISYIFAKFSLISETMIKWHYYADDHIRHVTTFMGCHALGWDASSSHKVPAKKQVTMEAAFSSHSLRQDRAPVAVQKCGHIAL